MQNYKIVLLWFVTGVASAAMMSSVETRVQNQSKDTINVFCQSSSPAIDRYAGDTGWNYSNWPIVNLEPGQEKVVTLWIFKEVDSQLMLSVVTANEDSIVSSDERMVNYLKFNCHRYIGDATFYREGSSLTKMQRGNVDCDVSGEGSYQVLLQVH